MLIFRGIPAQAGPPVALTIGNFDGVHLGHQAMLMRMVEAARSLDIPSCVMTFEPHPREFFSPHDAPARLTNLREKLELFSGLGVARVHVLRFNPDFSRTRAEDFIFRMVHRGLSAKWVLIGDDFRFGARRAGDLAMLQQAGKNLGFEVDVMESVALDGMRVSSTAVREALAAGRLAQAKKLLGRDYSISGRVVKGDRLGEKIGFPTANIQLKRNRPPVSGIFAVQARGIGQNVLKGAASLGVRPTVKHNGKPALEVHFFDFNRDIYGEHLRVDFLHKLRDEEKYPDLETLTRQIARDVENARSFFSGLIDA